MRKADTMAGIPASDDQGGPCFRGCCAHEFSLADRCLVCARLGAVWSWDEPATKLWLHNNMCGSTEHTEARKGHCQALVHDHAIRGDVLLLLSPQYLSKGTVASNHRPLLPVGPRLKLMAGRGCGCRVARCWPGVRGAIADRSA